MKCLDQPFDMFNLYGNYNSGTAANLFIVFERCQPETGVRVCKSETVIDNWLKGKYFLLLDNEKRFIKNQFHERSIDSTSKTKWYPVSPKTRDDNLRVIKRGSVELKDSFYSILGSYSDTNENFFTYDENVQPRAITYNDFMQKAITYEVSLDRLEFKRSVYTLSEFLSDVGGLVAALFGFGKIIVQLF